MSASIQRLCQPNLEQFITKGQWNALQDPKGDAGALEKADKEALELGVAASLELDKFFSALITLSNKRGDADGGHCPAQTAAPDFEHPQLEHHLSHLSGDERKDVLNRLSLCEQERHTHLAEINDANDLAKTIPDDLPIGQRIQDGLASRRKSELESLDTDRQQILEPRPRSSSLEERIDSPDYSFLYKDGKSLAVALTFAEKPLDELPNDERQRRQILLDAVHNTVRKTGVTHQQALDAMCCAANDAALSQLDNESPPREQVSPLLHDLKRETVETKNDGHCFFHATNSSTFSVSPTDLRASLLELFHGPKMDDQFVKNCFGKNGREEPNNVQIADCYLRIANGIGLEKCKGNAWGDAGMLPLVALKEQKPVVALTESGILLASPDGTRHEFNDVHSLNARLQDREAIYVTLANNHWSSTRPTSMPLGVDKV